MSVWPGQASLYAFFLLYLCFSFGASKSPVTEMSSLEPLESGGVEISFHVPKEPWRPRRPGMAGGRDEGRGPPAGCARPPPPSVSCPLFSPHCSRNTDDKALECQGSDLAVPAPGDRCHGKVHPCVHQCKGLPISLPLPPSLPPKPDVWPAALCSVCSSLFIPPGLEFM